MGHRLRDLSSVRWEVHVAWYAGCLSVLLTAAAFVTPSVYRVAVILAGALLAVWAERLYLRRTPAPAAVAVTVVAAALATAGEVQLSGVAWAAGRSASGAGGEGSPSAWLFSAMALCLAIGLLCAGRLVVRDGRRLGHIGRRGAIIAWLLPVDACIGFLVVGFCPVGSSRILSVAHNLAAVAGMGSFLVGMIACAWLLSRVSRSLRIFSGGAVLVILTAWIPTAVRFLGFIERSPVSTQHMELLVFALSFGWLWWLANDWATACSLVGATQQVRFADEEASGSGNAGGSEGAF